MKARDTGSDVSFEPCPTGNHIARCIRIIDLGTQHDEMYDKDRHQIFVMWEVPNEMKTYTVKGDNGAPDKEVTEPFTVSKFYTLSLAESAHLRADLESWRSRAFTEEELDGFEMKKVLGATAMVNVIHKQRKRGTGVNAVVTAVTPLPKGIECPPAVHEAIFFSLDPDDFGTKDQLQASFEKISGGLQKSIQASKEWREIWSDQPRPAQNQPQSTEPLGADEFDDIPF